MCSSLRPSRAADVHSLSDDVVAFKGLDTKLLRGRLSGGEKRSVANCRAMVSSPPIMLLDEFTAGLDAENEQCVTEAVVNNRPAGQTVIAVAQTLMTIRKADKIIFVGSDGTIKEQGTWDELVALQGGFAKFVKIQGLVTAKDEGGAAKDGDAAGGGGGGDDSGGGGGGADADADADADAGAGAGGAAAAAASAAADPGTDGDAATDAISPLVDIPRSPTRATKLWRTAKAKVNAVTRIVHSAAEHNSASNVKMATATIRELMTVANDCSMPPEQHEQLARALDNLIHSVKVDEALRPSNPVLMDKVLASALFMRSAPASPAQSRRPPVQRSASMPFTANVDQFIGRSASAEY